MRLPYKFACVDVDPRSQQMLDLEHVIEHARTCTRSTFTRGVDVEDRERVEAWLGYDSSFPITKDWHVRYAVSRLCDGRRALVLVHSAIEYVFHGEDG